ncbi:MAG: reverse transcriptase/maturase family protein [Candidatus Paceibacterota bacterium]|jgi:hypothetical protein
MSIFTIEKLHKAYTECLRHKKNTANALKFEMCKEKNLFRLLSDLQSRRYKISRHICFVVIEPTPREIFAADFRDRIVHHLLCNEIQEIFEKDFIETSYANRIGKGTHKALKKLKFYLSRGGKNGQRLFYLKMDIKGFFRNIDKEVLWKIIKEKILKEKKDEVWKKEVLWLLQIIIFHDPTTNYFFKGKTETKNLIRKDKSLFIGNKNKGLPIGNLTSQFFANIYLNKMDQYIKNRLGLERYIRYVDDFLVLDEDEEKLKKLVEVINVFLNEKLELKLCVDKTKLRRVENGIDFLGYFVKPTHILVRRKVVKRFKRKLFLAKSSQDGFCNIFDIPMIQSYLGHFGFANSFNLVKKLCA